MLDESDYVMDPDCTFLLKVKKRGTAAAQLSWQNRANSLKGKAETKVEVLIMQ